MLDTTSPAPATVEAAHHPPPRRTVAVLATVASLVVVSLLVLSTSRAAFTAQTSNEDNSWATGKVELTDSEQPSGVMFSVEGMVPGDEVTHEITVTNLSTVDSVDVHLYGAELEDSDPSLAEHLNLTISAGAAVYEGTVADFAQDHVDADSGVLTWADVPSGADVERTYTFTVEFDPGATDPSLQVAEAKIDFVWEAISNPSSS